MAPWRAHRRIARGWAALTVFVPLLVWAVPAAEAAPRPAVPFDPSFNAAGTPPGIVATMFGAGPGDYGAFATGVAVQDDGKIVVSAARYTGTETDLVARYTDDGIPDSLFGDQGIATLPQTAGSGVSKLGLDGDGRIVVAGASTVYRLTATGDPDATFQAPDLSSFGEPIGVSDIAVLASGATALVGVRGQPQGAQHLVVARLLPSGTLDTSFAPSAPTPGLLLLPDVAGTAPTVAMRADGSMVVATGSSLVGLTASGAPDPTFPDGGRVSSTNSLTNLAFDNASRVVVIGYTPGASRRAVVAWYSSVNGTVSLVHEVTSFSSWQPTALAIDDADDAVVIVGGDIGVSTYVATVARFTADGALDPTFSGSGTSAGRIVFPPPGGDYSSYANAVAVDGNGRPVVAGFGADGRGPGSHDTAFVARFPSSTVLGGSGLHVITPNRVLDTRAGLGAPATKLAAGSVLHLAIDGTPGVPASGVDAVTLNLTVTEPEAPGYLTAFPVYPCDAARAQVSNLNYAGGQTIANVVTVPVGPDGSVCLTAYSATHVVADVLGWYGEAGAGFTAAEPTRLMDTRFGLGAPRVSKLEPGRPLPVVIPPPPGSGPTSAVSVVVTVTEPDGAGFVRIHPCNQPPGPTTSTVNFVAGETVANAAIVASDQAVCVEAAPSAAHVVIDLAGWWGTTSGGGFTAVAPNRVLDTRAGVGVSTGALQPATTLRLAVTGTPGVPATDVTAVAVNLTATEPVAPGYLRAYACDASEPATSNLNHATGQTISAYNVVPVAADGTICLTTYAATHVVADIAGWFSVP
jgi:uncharacterized delta-60 repeat protein